jgi:flagellar biosynthesis protein FlhB
MIDREYFSWRSITELIRHITFVFVLAFLAAIFLRHHSLNEMVERAMHPNSLSNVFCSILVFSVPLYLVCLIIDTIDDVGIDYKSGGKGVGFVRSFFSRIWYDITYIFYFFR